MATENDGGKEPNFGAAPKSLSTSGKISGSLKGKVKGYRGLSKRARALAIAGVGAVLLLVVLGITAMPDPADTSARVKAEDDARRKEEDARRNGPNATVPDKIAGISGGIGIGAEDTPPEVPDVPPVSVDPLAGAHHDTGNNQPSTGGQLSLEEQQAQQERLARIQKLREARDSGLSDANQQLAQQQAAVAANPRPVGQGGGGTVVPPLGGGVGGMGMNPQALAQDDQNKQLRKEAFLEGSVGMAAAVPSTYLPASVQKPRSAYQLSAGWLIPAMMDSMMISDLPGTLRAHVSQNVMDSATGRFVLIPGGSKLVGHYDSQIAFGQSRVLVVWDLLIFPDGSELSLLGMQGVDQIGAAGLTGEVDNHLWTMVKAAVFMSVITAGAQLSQPQSQGNGNYQAPSVSQTLSGQLGQQLGQVSGNMVSKYLNIQPTIKTDPGTRFNVLVKQNVVFDGPWAWKK